MIATIYYNDETNYKGKVNDKMIPHGHGTYAPDTAGFYCGIWNNGTFSQLMKNGYYENYDLNTKVRLNGHHTCGTFYGKVSGYFVNGILNGFGIFYQSNIRHMAMFSRGMRNGRCESIIKYKKMTEYIYFVNDIQLKMTEWRIPTTSEQHVMFEGKHAMWNKELIVGSYTNEEITILEVKRHCINYEMTNSYIHEIGKQFIQNNMYLGIWRTVYTDGTVKLGSRYLSNKPIVYKVDGNVGIGSW